MQGKPKQIFYKYFSALAVNTAVPLWAAVINRLSHLDTNKYSGMVLHHLTQ